MSKGYARLLQGVAVSALAVAGSAEAAEIRGRVVEPTLNRALPGAQVRLQGTQVVATADRNGEFSFRDTPAGPATLVVSYIGYPDRTQEVTASDTPEPVTITLDNGATVGELVVTGQRLAERRALQTKKSAGNLIESLYADDVGKLPDQNVAEAVRRLPSITTANDQGEGRYVIIRGVNPNYANVTVNGQTQPAPEPEGRQVKLDDIPSSLIGSVSVVKSLTPDLDANAIAGSVDIITLSAFDRNQPFFLTARADAGRYDLNEKNPYQGDIVVGGLFGRDQQFGLVVSASYSNRPIESENFQGSTNYRAPVAANGYIVPDQFGVRDYNLTRERLGVTGALDWRPNDKTKLYARVTYATFSDDERRDQNRIDNQSAFTNQTATTGTFRGRGSVLIRRREEDDNTIGVNVGGRFDLPVGHLDLSYGYGRAEKEDPLRSEYNFRSGGTALTVNYDVASSLYVFDAGDAFTQGTLFPLNQVNYDRRDAVETVNQARADYTLPVNVFGQSWDFKTGFKVLDRHKTNERDIEVYGLTAGRSFTLANVGYYGARDFYDGRYPFGLRASWDAGQAYIAANPGVVTLNVASSRTNSLINDYDVSERIYAGYAMGTFKFDRLTLIPGVRVERTEDDLKSKVITAASTLNQGFNSFGKSEYTDVFPGVNARFDVNRNLVLRGAITTATARPNYQDLSSFVSVDLTTSPISVTQGNPGLKALYAVNYDVALEYYLPGQGVISVGAFYKDIDDPIYSQTLLGQSGAFGGQNLTGVSLITPINADHQKVQGLELNAQAQFTWLPGVLGGLGASFNAAFIDGDSTGVPGRAGGVPLFLQSRRVSTAQLFYEKYGFSARVAYSYRSRYLDTLGASSATDQFTDDNGQLDIRASYAVTKNLLVFFEGFNLNDAPWRRFIGTDDQLVERERYGAQLRAGVQFRY